MQHLWLPDRFGYLTKICIKNLNTSFGSDINGKILKVVKSLHSTAKSAVKLNNWHSVFFNCDIGVRQGDNLSPLLFALYLNDLQEHLAMAYNGLSSSCNLIQEWVQDEDTIVYLKLFYYFIC